MTQGAVTIAIIIGGLGAALGLINLILIAAVWSNHMATTAAGQSALAKLSAISTALAAALANADGAAATADLSEVNSAIDALGATVPGYVAPTETDPNAPV